MPHHRSRGTIIPKLMVHAEVRECMSDAAALDPADFPPFRLVMVDRANVAEVCSDGRTLSSLLAPRQPRPILFTSSGLGDHVVEPLRRRLFEELFSKAENWSAEQDRFHHHRWPDRPDVSVCMIREDAKTVSHTVIECRSGCVRLVYEPEPPDPSTRTVVTELKITESST